MTSTMARPKTFLVSSMCRSCRQQYLTQSRRPFSSTTTSQDTSRPSRGGLAQRFGVKFNDERKPAPIDALSAFADALATPSATQTNNVLRNSMKNDLRILNFDDNTSTSTSNPYQDEPYHLNVYAHRHNTHITFTEPSRNPIISFSCGNLGLRNAQKASYDASFQLAAYTFRKMAEKQWKIGGANAKTGAWLTLSSIKRPAYSGGGAGAGIEVILRGYGPGREAFQKALLGTEGRMIKPLISKVTDGTRLKFGGTRSPQVRRLG
jgi:small subunit ribosomal protein S11